MTLYTKYGMIQGTVDEILEFISKQNPTPTIQNNGTNQAIEDKIVELAPLSSVKTYHKCGYCGYEKAEVDTSMVLTSLPPKYSYKCPKCGKVGYILTIEV